MKCNYQQQNNIFYVICLREFTCCFIFELLIFTISLKISLKKNITKGSLHFHLLWKLHLFPIIQGFAGNGRDLDVAEEGSSLSNEHAESISGWDQMGILERNWIFTVSPSLAKASNAVKYQIYQLCTFFSFPFAYAMAST